MCCCESIVGNGGGLSAETVDGNTTKKVLTFLNTATQQVLFTVTGRVIVKLIPVCNTAVLSAAGANVRLGTLSDDDAMIVDTLATKLTAEEIWIDASPDSTIEPLDARREYMITNGDDIVLTPDAQVDSGEIEFKIWWTPISNNGNVVAA